MLIDSSAAVFSPRAEFAPGVTRPHLEAFWVVMMGVVVTSYLHLEGGRRAAGQHPTVLRTAPQKTFIPA